MKKLYDFRSKIVHGGLVKDDEIKSKLFDLENKVRQCLNSTIRMNVSKDELFDELNSKGF